MPPVRPDLRLVASECGPGNRGRLKAVNGDVRVRLPAAPEYGPMARTTAVHIARLLGFTADEVSDLRLTMEASVVLLLDPGRHDGSMTFNYRGKAGIITIEAAIDRKPISPTPHDRIDRFESTAGSRVDSWKLDPDQHRLWLQKTGGNVPQPASTAGRAESGRPS